MNHALVYRQKNKTSKVINHHNYRQSAEQNNAVKQLLVRHRIQAKLKISQPDDPLEREADDMADRVMGMSDAQAAKRSVVQTKSEYLTNSQDKTRLPGKLKNGIEFLSGYSMDDVKVHYNSPQPARLDAHAFTKGTDIHIAPGAEKHLPHEAWHVVQQKQGRVLPTRQLRGSVGVNDDVGLEREADLMGGRALHGGTFSSKWFDNLNCYGHKLSKENRLLSNTNAIQLYSGDYYKMSELIRYLKKVKNSNKIEGDFYSDNKARAVVNRWKGGRWHGLRIDRKAKALLILEMLDGLVYDEDENSILEILVRSKNSELNYMFRQPGINPRILSNKFNGEEYSKLSVFFKKRFGLSIIEAKKHKKLSATRRITEDNFGKGKDKIKFIRKIIVDFTETKSVILDLWWFGKKHLRKSFSKLKNKNNRSAFDFDYGIATVYYNDKTTEKFNVSGGAIGSSAYRTHKTKKGAYDTINSKGGAYYTNNNGDPMPYAAFFYRGQAFHGCGSRNWFYNLFSEDTCLKTPSHGCIHVRNSKISKLDQYIIRGKTKVKIR